LRRLTRKEIGEFLSGGRLIAKIATIGIDDFPYVNPVWYEWDGDYIYIVAREDSAHMKNIVKNPKVAVCIDRCEPPCTRVIMIGRAEILEGSTSSAEGEVLKHGLREAVRYLGKDMGERVFEEALKAFRYSLIRIVPKKTISFNR
jgi:nitroimidazol reductase NimA-like FMN-containing flavoprotein (pyridoxamine 5'-phosphate oxidase superfamily)